MTDIDTLLRDTLHDRADEAPSAAGLTGRVQVRSRRLRKRRLVAAAGVAAVFVVVAAVSGQAVVRGIPDGPAGRPGHPSRTPSAPPSGRPVPPEPSPVPVILAPPGYTLADFPFTPSSWAVQRFGPGQARFEDGEVTMRHAQGAPGAGSIVVFATTRSPEPRPAPGGPIERESVTVRGVAGTRYTDAGAGLVYLAWPEPAGRWIVVTGDHVPTADVQRYAEELVATPVPVPVPFEFAWLPHDAEPSRVTPSAMEFRVSHGTLEVSLLPGAAAPDRVSWTHRVGGRPAMLGRYAVGHVSLMIAIDADRVLLVEGRVLDIGDADLVRLAEGIRITQAAVPSPN